MRLPWEGRGRLQTTHSGGICVGKFWNSYSITVTRISLDLHWGELICGCGWHFPRCAPEGCVDPDASRAMFVPTVCEQKPCPLPAEWLRQHGPTAPCTDRCGVLENVTPSHGRCENTTKGLWDTQATGCCSRLVWERTEGWVTSSGNAVFNPLGVPASNLL